MSQALRRLAPLSGLGGIALLIAGLATDSAPTSSWPDTRIEAWYAHHGGGHWLFSAYLLAAAAPLILAFAVEVRHRMAAAGAGDRAQSLLLGAGTAFAVTILVGAGLYAAVPAAMTFASAPAPHADISRYLLGASYGTLVMFSAFAAALLAATVSVVSLRYRVLPRWLAVIGLPASLLMLANAALPMGVITLWYAAASIALTTRGAPTATIAARSVAVAVA
jgi:hypothetical protein